MDLTRIATALVGVALCGLAACKGGQGDPGEAGAQGTSGPAGEPGGKGATGPQGGPGATGARGATGPAGPMGDMGPTGPAGAMGDMGPTGPAGPMGDIGPTGPAGAQGATGATGIVEVLTVTDGPLIAIPSTQGTNTWVNAQRWSSATSQAVQLTAGQKVVASGTAVVGTSSGTASSFNYNPCYKLNGASTWSLFHGSEYPTTSITGKQVLGMSGSMKVPTTGSYVFSFCYMNLSPGGVSVNSNDYMNGWFLIAN